MAQMYEHSSESFNGVAGIVNVGELIVEESFENRTTSHRAN